MGSDFIQAIQGMLLLLVWPEGAASTSIVKLEALSLYSLCKCHRTGGLLNFSPSLVCLSLVDSGNFQQLILM
jgi:hypothetical protein